MRPHGETTRTSETARLAQGEGPRVRRAVDLLHLPPPTEIVQGLAWAGSISVLVGESGTGKTFVSLDLAAAVAEGLEWHGRDCHPCSVVYVAYEGTLTLRLRALVEHLGRSLHRLYVLRMTDPISPVRVREGEQRSMGELILASELEVVAKDCQARDELPPQLVIIDTVRASLSGNEDSSEDVAAYLRAIHRLLQPFPDAAALLVHHTGWQDLETARKRERGSSSWRGNVDATLYLEADGPYDAHTGTRRLVLKTLKVREGELVEPLRLIRRRVELDGFDARGCRLTSCIIERDPINAETRAEMAREAERAALRQTDLRLLRLMAGPGGVTSIEQLRITLGLRRNAVVEAVSRVVQAGWAQPGRRGQPYQVTPLGYEVLTQETHGDIHGANE